MASRCLRRWRLHSPAQADRVRSGEGEPEHWGPPYTSPLARARGAPRVRSCDRRIQMLWLVPAGAHGTSSWGAHTQLGDLTSSHLPRASCRRGCQGAARTERLLAHHGAARLCFSSPHPAPVAEGCSPTSLPAFLAPPAPPHTRRFLGGSLDARLLSRCAPASLQMRANAVFAPILLLLNMLPGARGFSLAPMAPLMRKTHIRQRPVVEPAKLLHTGRTSRRIVMQVAEPPARASARPSVHHSVPLPAPPPSTAHRVSCGRGGWRLDGALLPVLLSTRPFCSAVPRTRSRRTHVSGSARAIP